MDNLGYSLISGNLLKGEQKLNVNELSGIIDSLIKKGCGEYPVYADGYEIDTIEQREISINNNRDDIQAVVIDQKR